MHLGRQRVVLVAVSFAVLVFVIAGRLVGDDGQREKTYEDLATFTEVLHLVDTSYVDPVAEMELMEGAFRGMLSSLDPHSGWLSAEEARSLLESAGERIAAGVETTKRSGYSYIVRVLPGSPADKAGVKVGEYIRTINGRTTREMSDVQVRHLLSGPPDSLLNLNLFGDHEGRELDLALVPYSVTPVDATLDPDGVLVATLFALDAATVGALGDLLRQPPEGTQSLLLDLRNVVRGEEADVAALADLFLSEGVMLRVDERGREERTLSASASTAWDGPVALLVNQLSAGAAEMLVAALARNQRAEVLGEKTFGDASVQRLIRLPDESALILSVGRYTDAEGATWHREGLEPDVSIPVQVPEPATDGAEDGAERAAAAAAEQLRRAVDHVAGRGAVEKAA